MISLTDNDTEVAETFARESSALHSQLLWLTDPLVALNNKMEDARSRPTIQPSISQVWVQDLLLDSLAFLTVNTMLVQWDLAISSLTREVLKETLWNLRTSPLLGNLMFHLSIEDIALVQKRCNNKYMFQALKQAAQFKHPLPHEAKRAMTKPQGSFHTSTSTSQPKPEAHTI